MYNLLDYQLQGTRAAFHIIKKDLEAYLDILNQVRDHTGIPDVILRGSRIRIRYFMLLHEGMNGKQAKRCLAEEFCCAVKTIERHLYRIKFKKKSSRPPFPNGEDCR